jgi:4'-phosphopantetheinyl transferase
MRRMLGAHLGLAPRDVPIAAGPHGKPFVEGSAVRFNLSNCGPLAVLAVASGVEVGIDLEGVGRADRFEAELEGLSHQCLNAAERSALQQAPPNLRVRRFLSYWTAKEARMKLTGEGFGLDPLDIDLVLSGGLPVGYRRPLAPDAELRFVTLSDPGAICCLAIARGPAKSHAHQGGRS